MNTKAKSTKPTAAKRIAPTKKPQPKAPSTRLTSSAKSKADSTVKPASTKNRQKHSSATSTPTAKSSKQSLLIEMLRTDAGSTIEQMIALTGWQAHTVRGTISGVLRKKLRLNVQCALGPDLQSRIYRIVDGAAA